MPKSPKSPKRNRHHVQLQLNVESYTRLKSLQAQTGATTQTEVFRKALALYEELLTLTLAGNELWLCDKDKVVTKRLLVPV